MSTKQNLLRALDVEMHVQNVLMDIGGIYAELRDELDKIGIDGKTLMEWEGRPGLVHALEAWLERIPQAMRGELVQRGKEATEAWRRDLWDCPACGSQISIPSSGAFTCPACNARLACELTMLEPLPSACDASEADLLDDFARRGANDDDLD